MSKIEILPENLANKIAAGEVVQRPESVVKELIENSIDAGASSIELIVKKGGKTLIQVVDNGEGMLEDDAVLSIQKHATSKIKTYDDLEAINTLGFRGEALSSIASVSQFELKTKTADDELGILVKIEERESLEGKTLSQNYGIVKQKIAMEKGTTIIVKNLFYNIPARRNFLKTDATELKHITDIFNKIALSYPEIEFRFYSDEELIFHYKTGNLEDRVQSVFGEGISRALIPIEELTDFISIEGYIGKPTLLKKSKGEQYLFLNGRYVVSKQINHAVFSAYENILEKGEYPFFILFVTLDPRRIDVNVHPSKLEIRFDDERDVYSFVLSVVRKCLSSFDLVPNISLNPISFDSRRDSGERLSFDNSLKITKGDFSDRPVSENRDHLSKQNRYEKDYRKVDFSDKEIDLIFGSLPEIVDKKSGGDGISHPFEMNNRTVNVIKGSSDVTQSKTKDSAFIIQMHNKYILSQIKSGLMIIDQHVAHERILYEKAIHSFTAAMPLSQQLLFPKNIEFDPGSYQIIKEIYPFLNRIGFELEFHQKFVITIEGVPQEIKEGTEEELLREITDEYVTNLRQKNITDEKDNIAKSYSCKAAIKAGDRLSEKEMQFLIDQLFATSMPYVCPHGRPIIIKISLEEFDKRFGRT